MAVLKCLFCGKPVPPKAHGHGGNPRRYCSEDCGIRYRNGTGPVRQLKCRYCGESFSSAKKNALFCKYECFNLARRKRPKKVKCSTCGNPVPFKEAGTTGTQAEYCSDACRRARVAAAVLAKSHEWKAKGLCTACGGRLKEGDGNRCGDCATRRASLELKRRRTPDGWLSRVLHQAQRRAKRDGLPMTLTQADLLPLPTRCPILGIRIDYERKPIRGAHEDAPSLDRTDSETGYVPGNVRVISSRANRIKNDGTLAEHEAIVAYMERNIARARRPR